jgi:hypothetical protein
MASLRMAPDGETARGVQRRSGIVSEVCHVVAVGWFARYHKGLAPPPSTSIVTRACVRFLDNGFLTGRSRFAHLPGRGARDPVANRKEWK